MDRWKDNVSFVLVEPERAGNIGASARAMKNMGFSDLRLVRPRATIDEEAGWFAHGSIDVLESATVHDSLGEALSDASLVVGTTRRKGRKRGLFVPVEEAAERIRGFARGGRVAVLFGGERQGLLNEQLEHCAFAFSIPTARAQPSLNVAQAVLIAAYEISRAGHAGREKGAPGAGVISHAELGALLGRFDRVLELLGYGEKGGDVDVRKRISSNLARVFGRAGLTPGEASSFLGLCTQMEKKLRDKK